MNNERSNIANMDLEELNVTLDHGEHSHTLFMQYEEKVPAGFYAAANTLLNHKGRSSVLDEKEDGMDTLLFQKGSSRSEKGDKLKNVRINKINEIDFFEFQKGSSLVEKGGKLLSSSV